MTIDKSKQITLPQWVLSGLVSIILTGFTTWGIISAKAATLELRASHNEENIRALQDTKASKEEMNLILDLLHRIDIKLDDHVKK